MYIDVDDYVALLKGEYHLIPCSDCDCGTLYIDGQNGEIISPRRYEELREDSTLEESIDYYTEKCEKCFGVGKIAMID